MPRRCSWTGDNPLYVAYHDHEWGVPLRDDRALFELFCLEGQQAGLNWLVVLKKREHYRRCFHAFDPEKLARLTDSRMEKLLQDPGLVRNRLKLQAIRSNARAFLKLRDEHGPFADYLWSFTGGRTIDGKRQSSQDVPATSKESDALSRDMKRRGFKFAGSILCYAFMQGAGLVNDHTADCFRYRELRG